MKTLSCFLVDILEEEDGILKRRMETTNCSSIQNKIAFFIVFSTEDFM